MFSNGTEYMIFLENNCHKCPKYNDDIEKTCKIERKISLCTVLDYNDAKKQFPKNFIKEGKCIKFKEPVEE